MTKCCVCEYIIAVFKQNGVFPLSDPSARSLAYPNPACCLNMYITVKC
jgi:hypothetical protein